MDAYLGEEAVNPDDGSSWSFTSKALLFSNALISLLIVVILSFMYMTAGVVEGVDSDSGLEVSAGGNVGGSGGAGTGPAGSGGVSGSGGAGDVGGDVADNDSLADDSLADDILSDDLDVGVDGEFNSENPLGGSGGVDQAVLAIVEGCLRRQITGKQCDQTFVRDDIIDYCDELGSLDDRCYVMSALMNKNVNYCTPIKDNVLEGKCVFALSG